MFKGMDTKMRDTLMCRAFFIMVSGAGFEPARVLPH